MDQHHGRGAIQQDHEVARERCCIIAEFSESVRCGPDASVKAFVRRGQAMTARVEAFPKPIVAAVNGTREALDAWLAARASRQWPPPSRRA